jgi:hypothetical protein
MILTRGLIDPLTIHEVRRCGLTVADLARFTSISYSRLHRAINTGSFNHITPDELRAVRRALVLSKTRDPNFYADPLA